MKIFLRLLLIISLAFAFVDKPSARSSSTRLQLYRSVEAAIADAQRICADNPNSPECKVAWDIVEELEAADSHRGAGTAPPPEVLSLSAEYASLVQSYDILMQKTGRKMDQLKSLMMRLEELGVTDASVARLANLSDEMKFALAEAQASLNNYE